MKTKTLSFAIIFAMMMFVNNSFGQGLPPANSIGTCNNYGLPTTYNVGASATSYCTGFSVVITLSNSDAGVNYELWKNGIATGSILPGTGIGLMWGGQTAGTYTIVAEDALHGCQQTMTGSQTITENALPVITVQPTDKEVCEGGSTTYSITATGTGLTYQWYNDQNDGMGFVIIPGATTNSLSVTGITLAMNAFQYQCVVTNASTCTATSTAALLTVDPLPTITVQPTNEEACVGDNVTFTVTATIPSGTLNFQWVLSTNGGVSFNNIAGATNSSYTLTGVTGAMNNYQYKCYVTSSVGSCVVSTTAATLTVNALPTAFVVSATATNYCSSGTGVTITLSASTMNINYELWKDGVGTGLVLPGTGASLSWANQLFGTYTVIATNSITGCQRTMTGSQTINEIAIPTITSYTTTDVCDDILMPASIVGITGIGPWTIEIYDYDPVGPTVGALIHTETVTTSDVTIYFDPLNTGTVNTCVKVIDQTYLCPSW